MTLSGTWIPTKAESRSPSTGRFRAAASTTSEFPLKGPDFPHRINGGIFSQLYCPGLHRVGVVLDRNLNNTVGTNAPRILIVLGFPSVSVEIWYRFTRRQVAVNCTMVKYVVFSLVSLTISVF